MFFTTLVVMAALCLAFPITRAYGIAYFYWRKSHA